MVGNRVHFLPPLRTSALQGKMCMANTKLPAFIKDGELYAGICNFGLHPAPILPAPASILHTTATLLQVELPEVISKCKHKIP